MYIQNGNLAMKKLSNSGEVAWENFHYYNCIKYVMRTIPSDV